jgi:hypothetical protein
VVGVVAADRKDRWRKSHAASVQATRVPQEACIDGYLRCASACARSSAERAASLYTVRTGSGS